MQGVANNLSGKERKTFLQRLHACTFERFQALATENNSPMSFRSVREAETMLQTEFQGIREHKSITRPNSREYQAENM